MSLEGRLWQFQCAGEAAAAAANGAKMAKAITAQEKERKKPGIFKGNYALKTYIK